jgi:hypothetical protein
LKSIVPKRYKAISRRPIIAATLEAKSAWAFIYSSFENAGKVWGYRTGLFLFRNKDLGEFQFNNLG